MGVLRIRGSDGKFVGIPTLRGERGPQGPQGPKGDAGNIEELGSLTPDELDTLIDSGDDGTLTDRVVQGRVIPRLWARIKAAFVRKVNGKSADGNGNVQLTASDVGARADNWMPTAAQVGAVAKSGGTVEGKLNVPSLGVVGTNGTAKGWIGVDEITGKYNFVEYAPGESKYEYFALPDPATGLTANVRRNILTDKTPVTIAQGGTGATTAAAARTALGVTPANIGARPSSWTPTAAEVGAAPSNHTHYYAASTAIGGAANSANSLNALAIPASSDLNSYTVPGFYKCAANSTMKTLSNCPTSYAFFMIVGQHAGTFQLLVEYLANGSAKVYFRNYYIPGWAEWKRIYSENDPPSINDIGAAASVHHHSTLYLYSDSGPETAWVMSNGSTPCITVSKNGNQFALQRSASDRNVLHYHTYNANGGWQGEYDLWSKYNLKFEPKNNGTELHITTI